MSEGIVYQNKDVEFKMISETFKEKSFAAYGLDLPKIKAVLPTNLPAVFEYSCAATPQIRQTGNRLSGLAETAYASLLAQCFV